jgi:hypothetical protein
VGKGLKRKLRNIHNPLYPPYLKGDVKGGNAYFLEGSKKAFP